MGGLSVSEQDRARFGVEMLTRRWLEGISLPRPYKVPTRRPPENVIILYDKIIIEERFY